MRQHERCGAPTPSPTPSPCGAEEDEEDHHDGGGRRRLGVVAGEQAPGWGFSSGLAAPRWRVGARQGARGRHGRHAALRWQLRRQPCWISRPSWDGAVIHGLACSTVGCCGGGGDERPPRGDATRATATPRPLPQLPSPLLLGVKRAPPPRRRRTGEAMDDGGRSRSWRSTSRRTTPSPTTFGVVESTPPADTQRRRLPRRRRQSHHSSAPANSRCGRSCCCCCCGSSRRRPCLSGVARGPGRRARCDQLRDAVLADGAGDVAEEASAAPWRRSCSRTRWRTMWSGCGSSSSTGRGPGRAGRPAVLARAEAKSQEKLERRAPTSAADERHDRGRASPWRASRRRPSRASPWERRAPADFDLTFGGALLKGASVTLATAAGTGWWGATAWASTLLRAISSRTLPCRGTCPSCTWSRRWSGRDAGRGQRPPGRRGRSALLEERRLTAVSSSGLLTARRSGGRLRLAAIDADKAPARACTIWGAEGAAWQRA